MDIASSFLLPPSSEFPKVTSVSFAQTLEDVFGKITGTNICDLVMSIVIMAVVFVVKELNDKYKAKLPVPIPIEVIMVRRGVLSKGGARILFNTINLIEGGSNVTKLHKPLCNLIFESELTKWLMVCVQ